MISYEKELCEVFKMSEVIIDSPPTHPRTQVRHTNDSHAAEVSMTTREIFLTFIMVPVNHANIRFDFIS